MNKCFSIKYFIPFCLTFIFPMKKIMFINVFFFVDTILYSLLSGLINAFFTVGYIAYENTYFINLVSLSFLFAMHFHENYTELFIYFATLFSGFTIDKKMPGTLCVFSLVFSFLFVILYYLQFILNKNIKYEFNKNGLIITISNYLLLLLLFHKYNYKFINGDN